MPYDDAYRELYLALVAGLSGYGLIPHATLEIPTHHRRLDRITDLIRRCRYSFHDLSRVQIDRHPPPTPRFNMPFEAGLTVGLVLTALRRHRWFLLESIPHRLEKSLSDLNGTDPRIHRDTPRGMLIAVTNALVRARGVQPTLEELTAIYDDLSRIARRIRRTYGTLFDARPFQDLVLAARASARRHVQKRH